MKFTIASLENLSEDRPESVHSYSGTTETAANRVGPLESVSRLTDLISSLPEDQTVELSFQPGFEAEMVTFTQIDETDPSLWNLRPSTDANPGRAYAWAYHGHGSAYTFGIVSRRDWNKLHGILEMPVNGKTRHFLVCSSYMRNAARTVANRPSALGINPWSLTSAGLNAHGDAVDELRKSATVHPVGDGQTALCTIGVGDVSDGVFMSGWRSTYNIINWRIVRHDPTRSDPEVIRGGFLSRP